MASYYVAPIGTNGSGTLADPFGIPNLTATLGSATVPGVAFASLLPGDTLYFRQGDYHVVGSTVIGDNTRQILGPPRSGTALQPITIQSYPGEIATIYQDTGTQPILGTELPTYSYIRFLGLKVVMPPTFGGPGFRISGTGNEIGYCEVVGQFVNTADNHDGIRIDFASSTWIHHNNIHDVQGTHHNSVGIKMYASLLSIIEDNYIHGCFAAVYDKDSGTVDYAEQTTYRRNWFTNNSYPSFVGNDNSAKIGIYYLYDNVFDVNTTNTLAGIRINDVQVAPANQCQIYNNLFRNMVSGQATMSSYMCNQENVWNNIVLSSGSPVVGYYEYFTVFVASGPSAPLAYMDYNVYDGAPSYKFGQFSTPSSFTLAQFRAQGLEINSSVAPATDIFVDQVSYLLKPAFVSAGRYGDMVGPRYPVASILDAARYGPAAMGSPPPPPPPPDTTATLTGPPTAIRGVLSSRFFVALSGVYTGTMTPTDGGAGGTFTPSSLVWINTSDTKAFQYTPANLGVIIITVTGDPALVVAGSPFQLTVRKYRK